MGQVKKNLGSQLTSQFQNLEGRHPSQWPILPRSLCGVGVLALVLGLGWQLHWSGQLDELEYAQAQEQELRQAYVSKMKQAVNLEGLREQKQQVMDYVATLEKQLPSKAEMDALLSDINQAGVGRGLQFELFKPGQATVKEYYAELPITIKITGSYHDIGQFASDVAHLPRIVTLNDISISSDQKSSTLTLDAVAKTFRYLDQEEISAQRATEQKSQKQKGRGR